MATELTDADLDALRAFDTPTICNALEIVAPERRALGFTTESLISAVRRSSKPMVGYARTCLYRAMLPSPVRALPSCAPARIEYYQYVESGHRA